MMDCVDSIFPLPSCHFFKFGIVAIGSTNLDAIRPESIGNFRFFWLFHKFTTV